MTDPATRARVSQLASLIQEMEMRVSKQGSVRSENLTSVHNQLAELEHALNLEISRRGDLERRLSESADFKIKAAMDRLADAVESEMTRLYRKMDAEITGRLDQFSKELASTQSQRIPVLERTVESVFESQKRLNEQIGRLDLRLKLLDERFDEGNKSSVLVDQIRVHAREDIARLRSDIAREVSEVRTELKDVRTHISDLNGRVETEVSTVQAELQAETDTRREADKELIELITQYANVMSKQ